MIPYNEDFHRRHTGPTLAIDYIEAGRQVGDDQDWIVWPARVERDVCLGLTYEQSLAKHRAEWRQALGLTHPNPPTPIPPATAITTRLIARGISLEDESGVYWSQQGCSMFTLGARHKRGENVDPQCEWLVRHFCNDVRLFTNWVVDWEHQPNLEWNDPDHIHAVDRYTMTFAQRGLRSSCVLITESNLPLDYWQRALRQLYDLAAAKPWIRIEFYNEPWTRDTATQGYLAALQAVPRPPGVLVSTGWKPTPKAPDGFFPMDPDTYAQYGTYRTSRDEHYPGNPREILDLHSTTPIPWCDDEPMGLADASSHSGRTNDLIATASHFGVGRLFGGTRIHPESGIYGLTPEQRGESQTDEICNMITRIWQFMPNDLERGRYVNVGRENHGPGILYADHDSKINKCYGVEKDGSLWVVLPVPRDNWEAQAAPGWRIADVGPVPFILRCERT